MGTPGEKQVSRLPARVEREAVARANSAQGFQTLYQQYLSMIYRYVYIHIRNREDAEDLTSQVFLKALREVDYERGPKVIRYWLFLVTRTTVVDYWRARSRLFSYSLEELLESDCERTDEEEPTTISSKRVECPQCLLACLSTPSLEELIETDWERTDEEEPTKMSSKSAERVQRLLQSLPEHYREVLTCRFLLNLSIKETALRMGLTAANVKVVQLRALRRAASIEPFVIG